MNKERYLLVVSGPSGIGKDTVVQFLIRNHPGVELAVSATTRPPRGYEVDGEHYFFMSRKQFAEKTAEGAFLETTEYAGNCYGTLKSEVEKRINTGVVCVLVIEVNGAANIKKEYPECTTVFIVAPDMAEHERRLRGRGSESEETIQARMAIAQREMRLADEYDFQLVNDASSECAERLYDILQRRLAE